MALLVAWDNLWKWLCFVPGTVRARVVLAIWQFGLMTVPAMAVLGPSVVLRWEFWAGLALAFFAHELFFAMYARYLAGARIMDDGDMVGRDHRADYTFERYIGPVC